MKKSAIITLLVLSACLPVLANAALVNINASGSINGANHQYGGYGSSAFPSSGQLNNITDANSLMKRLATLGDVAVYLMVALAVIYIVWTSVRYFVMGTDGDEGRKKAGMQILWGIVGLFVILSLWGLVNILINTFSTTASIQTDRIPNADFVNKK